MYELILIPVILLSILLNVPGIVKLWQTQTGLTSEGLVAENSKNTERKGDIMAGIKTVRIPEKVLSGRFAVWLLADKWHNMILNYNDDS